MLQLIMLMVYIMLFSGCGDGVDGDNFNVIPSIPQANIAGTWKGTAISTPAGPIVNISLSISQDGANITGSYVCGGDCRLHSNGTLTGTVKGIRLTGSLIFQDSHSCETFSANILGNAMEGEYSCTDPAGDDSGLWSVKLQ